MCVIFVAKVVFFKKNISIKIIFIKMQIQVS